MNDKNDLSESYTYAQSGVSIDAGNALVRAIAPLAKATRRAGADADLGGFGDAVCADVGNGLADRGGARHGQETGK